jgi:hypothetical protein
MRIFLLILGSALLGLAGAATSPDVHDALVLVLKDGHRHSFHMPDVARIDLKGPVKVVFKDGHQEKLAGEVERIELGVPDIVALPGRKHFVGKWECGQGNGSNFYITLNDDGTAKKSIGSTHGTWTLVDGEAHISWDDGWHDAIRKVGTGHQKIAFEPGKSFSDSPANVTTARNTQPKPI